MSAFVEIGGERYELAEPASFDYDEAKLAKAISGGMGLAELEAGLSGSDVDAWTAVAFISMRRVKPKVTQAEVVAALRKQPLLAVVNSLESEEPEVEVDDPRPPAQPEPPSGEPGSSGESGAP